ncbi:unnamed protein product [Closterium sp. Naga37s-1]|nr:unnamed protein product [Closterium sp. Naga37s-1]
MRSEMRSAAHLYGRQGENQGRRKGSDSVGGSGVHGGDYSEVFPVPASLHEAEDLLQQLIKETRSLASPSGVNLVAFSGGVISVAQAAALSLKAPPVLTHLGPASTALPGSGESSGLTQLGPSCIALPAQQTGVWSGGDSKHSLASLPSLSSPPLPQAVARAAGLPNWDLAASPCLRSRLAFGVEATASTLMLVERAEYMVSGGEGGSSSSCNASMARNSSLALPPNRRFAQLTRLRTLSLSRCELLEALPDDLTELKLLQQLDVRWCKKAIDRMPRALRRGIRNMHGLTLMSSAAV